MIIESPSKFFKENKSEFTLKKTSLYLFIIALLISISHIISLTLVRMFINTTTLGDIELLLPLFSLKNFFISILTYIALGVVQAILLFVFQVLAKCGLSFKDVFAVSVCSMSPLLFAALPVGILKVIVPFWQITIIAIGVKYIAKTSNSKTAAVLMPYVLLVMVVSMIYFQRVTLPKTQQITKEMTGLNTFNKNYGNISNKRNSIICGQ